MAPSRAPFLPIRSCPQWTLVLGYKDLSDQFNAQNKNTKPPMPKIAIRFNTPIEEALKDVVITRYRRILQDAKITTVGELTSRTADEFSQIDQIGKGVQEQVQGFLDDNDLKFGMTTDDWSAIDPEFDKAQPIMPPSRLTEVPRHKTPSTRTYEGMVGHVEEAHSPFGLTTGLIDSIITNCHLLQERNLDNPEVQKALENLREDPAVAYVLDR
jgi:hypothetical protein